MKTTTIFIADDHEILLSGLQLLIEAVPQYRVIGHAVEGSDALEKILTLRPDIAILDLAFPNMNGIDITRVLKTESAETKIIILTSFSEKQQIREVFRLGVNGYILKDNPPDELLRAIDTVIRGYPYIDSRISELLISLISEEQPYATSGTLSRRENEILKLIVQGFSGKQICSDLDICESTLKSHKSNIKRKMNVSTTPELIVETLKRKIFPDL